MVAPVRAHHLAQMKAQGTPIAMITAYDALSARIFDQAGIDMILVGDSYGNTMLGYSSTIPVTLEEMKVATGAVVRATERAFVVADMPFGSYEESDAQAVRSAVALMKLGANAVKLEGGERRASAIKAITDAGIPVVAHVGFTPQAENALGGHRVQGRGDDGSAALRADALAVQEAGAIAVVFEMVPEPIATALTKELAIPTIGIGAGPHTDGQVLVWTDMAGMGDWRPKFAKAFGEVGAALRQATDDYIAAVKDRSFPDEDHSFAK